FSRDWSSDVCSSDLQRQRRHAVRVADRGRGAVEDVGEVVHLAAIGLRVAVEEEVLETVGGRAGFAPNLHGGLEYVVGPRHAARGIRLDALVVAEATAAAVADHAELAAGGAQQRARGIDVAQPADLRIHQAAAGGIDL